MARQAGPSEHDGGFAASRAELEKVFMFAAQHTPVVPSRVCGHTCSVLTAATVQPETTSPSLALHLVLKQSVVACSLACSPHAALVSCSTRASQVHCARAVPSMNKFSSSCDTPGNVPCQHAVPCLSTALHCRFAHTITLGVSAPRIRRTRSTGALRDGCYDQGPRGRVHAPLPRRRSRGEPRPPQPAPPPADPETPSRPARSVGRTCRGCDAAQGCSAAAGRAPRAARGERRRPGRRGRGGPAVSEV